MSTGIAILIVLSVGYLLVVQISKWNWETPQEAFPKHWKPILQKEVPFYNALSTEEKARFEFKISEFLLNCRVTGIETEIDDSDRLLVAASAVIPIFAFPNWKYSNISEVLIYPKMFNQEFETEGDERNVLGMVGNGYMNGMMILSKPALRHGFKNESDKKNTAIHEFVHLIDKMDGTIDGIPSVLLERQYTIPWMDLMNQKIEEIYEGESDINPYGGTNRAEFFSVVSEYFFERPKLLEKNHPKLYALLEEIFDHDMAERNLSKPQGKIGRNNPCPCNSGKKFKHCCGRVHYQ